MSTTETAAPAASAPAMDTKGDTVHKGVGFCATGLGSNICDIDVDRDADKIIRIRPYHFDETGDMERLNPWKIEVDGHVLEPGTYTTYSPIQAAYKQRVYSKNRILHPMKRVDWDPDGDRHPETRGVSGYERISWDEALDIIAKEMKRIVETYGISAIYAQADGHGEAKMVHGTHGCQTRLLAKIQDGGYTFQCRQPDSWEGWYWGAKHIWGMDPFGEQSQQTNLIKDIAENGDAVLFWGCDPETTTFGWGSQMPARAERFFTECGIKQIHISPDVNYANAAHADKWIPVLPNTDAAMQLAIAYVWLTEGTFDEQYLETHAVGFWNWAYYVLGGEDGIAKTPEWAEKKCGVPAYTIKALARYWATHKVSTAHCNGGSYIRAAFAHEPARLEVALLGMQGLGKPGANQLKLIELGLFGSKQVNPFPGGEEIPAVPSAYRGRLDIFRDNQIPKTMLPEAIMNPPIQWYSHLACGLPRQDQFFGPYQYPNEGASRIHMIWSDAPCWTTCWNGGNPMQDALRDPSIEFYMVQHIWMENDCNFADLLVPITTKFEDTDICTDTDNGAYNVVFYEKQAISPRGEAVSDMEFVKMVAKRLDEEGGVFEGVYDRYTEGREVDDWIRLGFNDTSASQEMTFEEFKEQQSYVVPTRKNWKEERAGLIDFYENPEEFLLKTPSGKLEYYSEELGLVFPDDTERTPMPRWIEEGAGHADRITSERAKKYPFLLVSNHPHWRIHAQGDDIAWFRELEGQCKVTGPDGYKYEPIWVNPVDAAKMGLETGDIAGLYNERGMVLGGIVVTERIMPGVVYQDHGARTDTIVAGVGGIDRGGANNLLAPTATTSRYSYGEVTSGYLVGLKKVDVFELAKQYPEAFGRPYDEEIGLVAATRFGTEE